MSDQNPLASRHDDELPVEELESVAGGAPEAEIDTNANCPCTNYCKPTNP